MPVNAIIQISFMGYLTKEIKIGIQSNLHIVLKEDLQLLDEVVVVDYGIQKKVTLNPNLKQLFNWE